ncbi:MAG: hypothetical protein Q8903_07655 [Bacteroidota bacterium]|nr:hypothetical protein [Bacteroidota bacterium]
MLKKIIICCIVLFAQICFCQNNSFTSEKERKEFKEKVNQLVKEVSSLKFNQGNAKKFNEFFWSIELIQIKNRDIYNTLKLAAKYFNNVDSETQRGYLEVLYGLFPTEFTDEVFQILNKTENPKLFAMCVHYLIRANYNAFDSKFYSDLTERKFKEYKKNPILLCLTEDISKPGKDRPELADLLQQPFGKNNIVIFSLQRKDRKNTGMVIIKDANGKFVKDENGGLFAVPQMAMAVSNLPCYLTNGNTPQGIFSFKSIDAPTNKFIGTTPLLTTVLPFELSYDAWLPDSVKGKKVEWSLDLYKNLLPKSWQNYFPIYYAFYAGKAGRSEIVSHGTAIDPSYYSKEKYTPFTPSLGCLSTKEIWDKDGRLVESDQLKLLKAIGSTNKTKGFLVVVELDDKNEPVSLSEVENIIKELDNRGK